MTLRCPYCKELFGPDPVAVCPHCHKSMAIPDPLLKHPYRERKRIKDRIVREAEKKRAAILHPGARFGRQPATIVFLLLLMLLTGAALLSRTGARRAACPAGNRWTTAERELEVLRTALERFRLHCGRYPTGAEGLRALVRDPGAPGWAGPYVNLVKPDPWRTPYDYQATGESILLRSRGPDRQANTPDDLQPDPPTGDPR